MLDLFRWTQRAWRKRIVGMPITNLSERDGYVRSPRVASLGRVMILVTGLYFCSSLGLWAQRTDAQNNDANWSWTVTSESIADNVNPTRTTESHTQTGNRSLDKQSLQVRGPDGHFEAYQDIEKETVQVDSLAPCEPPPARSLEMPTGRKHWCS